MLCGSKNYQDISDLQHLKTSLEKLCISSNYLNTPENVPKYHGTAIFSEKFVVDLVNNEISLKINLDKLNISSYNLLEVPHEVWKLKYLTYLNLSHNSLEYIPKEIKFLQNLLILDVSYNKLKCLPKSLRHNHHLTVLNLKYNKFSEVPDIIYFGLRKIKILDVSFNNICKFNEPPECLTNIVELRLSHNSLEKLPCWIFNSICKLQILDVSDNSMKIFKEFVVNYFYSGIFETLKILNIENCNFTNERLEFLSYFKNLEVIFMGNKEESNNYKESKNYLGNLKMDMFRNNKKVTVLGLQNAQISFLPSDFNCLRNLEFLNLLGNIVSWLPENFCNLVQLKVLNLSSNQLSFLPNDIHLLVNLQRIHVDNNNLHELPENFYKLNNLEFIDLYNNKLEKFDLNVFIKGRLKGIDLGLNCIHFNVLEDGDRNVVKEQYEMLKNNFRQLFNLESIRSDEQLPKSEGNLGAFDDSTRISDDVCESMSLSDDEDVGVPQIDQNMSDVEDDWEKVSSHESEEDELFDPNRRIICNNRPVNAVSTFQNNYCPSNNHVRPVMYTYFVKDNLIAKSEVVEEGQFDSD